MSEEELKVIYEKTKGIMHITQHIRFWDYFNLLKEESSLVEKQQKELENNKKFKKDIVNLIMLWDKKELPENKMIIETLKTIMHEFSRLENIEDEKIQVAVGFVEEKRDKYWKDKIRGKIKELEEQIKKKKKRNKKEWVGFEENEIEILEELLGEEND